MSATNPDALRRRRGTRDRDDETRRRIGVRVRLERRGRRWL